MGTSGNLSARVSEHPESTVVITASGRDKGALGHDDFVEVALDGAVIHAGRGLSPSAETSIHLAIYQAAPRCGAVLHVHTIASTLIRPSEGVPGSVSFESLEMLKGWGLWEEGAQAELPVFENHADVGRIAEAVAAQLSIAARVPALVIAGHGLTAWGPTVADAHRHVEITEFLCRLATQP